MTADGRLLMFSLIAHSPQNTTTQKTKGTTNDLIVLHQLKSLLLSQLSNKQVQTHGNGIIREISGPSVKKRDGRETET